MPRVSRRTGWTLTLFLALAALTLTGPALAQEGGGASKEGKNAFRMFFTSEDAFGQVIIIMLAFASVAVVSMTIQSYLSNRRKVIMPEESMAEYAQMADEKQYAGMINKAATDPSMFGKVLHASLTQAPQGYEAMKRAIEEHAEVLGTAKIRKLEVLNIMGAVGPMAGLFGTVYGMIVAFQAMVTAGGQPKPAELAGGVSTALVCTFWGLVVAIPAIVAAAVSRNHIEGMVVDIMVRAEELIARFKPAKKKPAPSPSTAPTAISAKPRVAVAER